MAEPQLQGTTLHIGHVPASSCCEQINVNKGISLKHAFEDSCICRMPLTLSAKAIHMPVLEEKVSQLAMLLSLPVTQLHYPAV